VEKVMMKTTEQRAVWRTLLAGIALLMALGALTGTRGALAARAQSSPATVQGTTIGIAISGFRFTPENMTVQVGDTVTWTNNDTAPHTVDADNRAFKSGTLRQGESYSYQAAQPGVYTYYCQFHPYMKGTITVVGSSSRTFAETGQTVQGRFLAYWEAHGGLALNGYPISGEIMETLEDGKSYTVQYFERARLEYHPENAAPNDVLLGQFGRRIRPADEPVAARAGATFFPQTGHNIDGGFLAYWQANGDVAQFGYPISEVFGETLGDGKSYQVQYFERARFEYHPENAAPYDILLGQFGRQIYAR
jgi:plastocyanin